MGTISIGATQIDVDEHDGTVEVPFVRTGDLKAMEAVRYRTVNDTAAAGADYVSTTGTATFRPGEARVTVAIPILDDNLDEGSENFSVQVLSIEGGEFGFPRTANVIIVDDEAPSGPTTLDEPNLAIAPKLIAVRGLVAPTAFDWVPGQPETMLIAEKSGLVRVAKGGTLLDEPLLDLRAMVNDVRDRGLLGIEVHPDFATQPYLYAYFVVDPPDVANNPEGSRAGPDGAGNRYMHLMRFTVDTVAGELQVKPGSGVILLGAAGKSLADISGGGAIDNDQNYNQPASGIRPDGSNVQDYLTSDSMSHSGGDMEFGPDGALYVSVGDGTYANSADPRTGRVQDIDNLSGKVLRIDPLTGKGLADNPFFLPGNSDANQSKVYQLGFRNPFRMTFDADGDLFVGDVGWYSWEEINTGPAGANFGWPYYEGGQNGANLKTPTYQDFPQAEAFYASGKTVTAPFLAFSHLESDPGFLMQALIMGDVATGIKHPEALRGNLVVAELNTGRIFSVDPEDPEQGALQLGNQDAYIVSMKQGPDGVLYYADFGAGTINELQIAPATVPEGGLITVGAGPDALVLRIQQDAYEGDAQYTVDIDGVRIGGILSASATRASGMFDTVTVRADLAPGPHIIGINFLNDAYGGTAAADRNLFVTSTTYNGETVALGTRNLLSTGPAFITVQDATSVSGTPPGGGVGEGVSTTIGGRTDTLVLRLQQDAYQGSAQYTVKIDGVQIGGTLTASATRASGMFDILTVQGDFTPGRHRAEITFLKDVYDGTPATDRNLFVTSATYNGTTLAGGTRNLLSTGSSTFIDFQDTTPPGLFNALD